MQSSVFENSSSRPVLLVFLLTAAGLLYASWDYFPATRALWDMADRETFLLLNGTLPFHPYWQAFWAVGNTYWFDVVSGFLIFCLLVPYVLAENAKYATERVAVILCMATVTATTLLSARILQDPRPSASLSVTPAYYLSEMAPWIKTKDRSYNSFPSDHAGGFMLLTALLWFFIGKRAGFVMVGVSLFFTFPRLIGGAHWLTDVAVGSVALAMAGSAIALCTPVYVFLIRGFLFLLEKPFCQFFIRRFVFLCGNARGRRS